MKLESAILLFFCVWVTGGLAASCTNNPCFAGFTDIPGISSLCNNAVRPTTTVDMTVGAESTVTSTITAPFYRSTTYVTTSARPTRLATCGPGAARIAAPAVATVSSEGFVASKVVAERAAAPRLEHRAPPQSCGSFKDQLARACKCFFPPGPQVTVTRTERTPGVTYTTVATTTSADYRVLTKTIVDGCAPTQAPIFGIARYGVCGSNGIPSADYMVCPTTLTNSTAPPFTVLSEDCCSACANTLDCFLAYTDASTNTCFLDVRKRRDPTNRNVTTDCPRAHTFARFGSQIGVEGGGSYYSGLLTGHCAQDC